MKVHRFQLHRTIQGTLQHTLEILFDLLIVLIYMAYVVFNYSNHYFRYMLVLPNMHYIPIAQHYFKFYYMDLDLEGRMLSSLNQAIAWAEARESQLMGEVLDLQRRINKIYDTKPVIRKRELKEQIKQKEQIRQQNVKAEFEKKIDEMISKAEQQIQEIDNPSKNKKQSTTIAKQTRMVQPLPQIQKKPPIPTINRSKDPQIVTHKPNYHYRNKNEVTGKITQTPQSKPSSNKLTTSNSMKKQQTKNIFHQSVQKYNKQPNKKVIDKQSKNEATNSNVNNHQSNDAIRDVRKGASSADAKIQKGKQEKIMYVDFCTFQHHVSELVERVKQKESKKVGSKRQIIQNLIAEYNKNQMGYKQNENKAVNGFLSSFSKLSATRTRLPTKATISIAPRTREAHLETFNFQNLLDTFQSLLNQNPISEEYSPSPKEITKIKHWHQILNQLLQEQLIETRQNLKLPPTLGIEFQMNENQRGNGESIENGQNGENNPYLEDFYENLSASLEELKNLEQFDKNALKKLRVLILIGLYEGKRSPVMIQSDKYEEWIQYYLN